MSSLLQDAIYSETSVLARNFPDARINPQILQEMLKDLDDREVISIIFLMVDKDTNFSKVIADVKKDPRAAFIELTNQNAWTVKLLESLLVIKNKYVLERMAFSQNEIQDLEKHNVSIYLNKAIKSLYFLCKNVDDNEAIKLVTDVNDKLSKPVKINCSKLCLELYILEWLNQKYISIDPDNCDLSNLLKNLKRIGCSVDLFSIFNFDYWKNCNSTSNNNKQDSYVWSYPGHKKLCIIVNQINFRATYESRYESRKGSEIDEKSLETTFTGCGFEVIIHQDYTEEKMIKLLDSLNSNNESYSTYGAIFICILSHGFEGNIVFSDEKAIPIVKITEKFCCERLQKVFKFLILQSCQGKQIGMVGRREKHLVKDGPHISISPSLCMHFILFKATVIGYVAMRHKKEGSWFIQDLCQEIREANKPIEITELIPKVTKRVTDRKVEYGDQYAIQVPELSGVITIPYIIPKFEEKNIKLKENN